MGNRQIFVRFCGCNLNCAYCDTPDARIRKESCRVETSPGIRDFEVLSNPVAVQDILKFVRRLDVPRSLHHSISFTGGEPLLQAEFCYLLASELHSANFSIMLETNGSLPYVLPPVLPFVDYIVMDIKLPSSTGGPNLMREHAEFLKYGSGKPIHVKIVVTNATKVEEIEEAARTVASVDRWIPVVLQPVTPVGGIVPPSPEQILAWQSYCKRYLRDVRVIPQTHKLISQL